SASSAPPPRPPRTGSPGWSRGLRYTSYVLYGLSAVTALAAIGSWRSYVGSEDLASTHLDQLQAELKSANKLFGYRDLFASGSILQSCSGAPGLSGSASYQGYLSECKTGNSLAQASTGLWIATASLAALGITSMILSAALKPPERKASPAGE